MGGAGTRDEKIDQLLQQVEQQWYVPDQFGTGRPGPKDSKRQKLFDILRKAAQDAQTNADRW